MVGGATELVVLPYERAHQHTQQRAVPQRIAKPLDFPDVSGGDQEAVEYQTGG